MAEKSSITCPKGAIKVTHMGEREWMFEYPRLDWEAMEEFHEALEYWRVGDFTFAEEIYNELIDGFPEFIDVHHHLALLLSVTEREEEAFQIWQNVVALGLDCLPKEFEMGQDRLDHDLLAKALGPLRAGEPYLGHTAARDQGVDLVASERVTRLHSKGPYLRSAAPPPAHADGRARIFSSFLRLSLII